VAFGPRLPLSTNTKDLKQQVFELSEDAWHSYSGNLKPIPMAWLRTARRHPWATSCDDYSGLRLNNLDLVTRVVTLSSAMRLGHAASHVGVLLPAGADTIATTLAALLRGHAVVHLDYRDGMEGFRSAVELAAVRQVFTTREHLQALADTDLDALSQLVNINLLDDIRATAPAWRSLVARILFLLLPVSGFYAFYSRRPTIDNTAAIVICSARHRHQRRAILLTHRNMMVNIKQVADVLNTQLDDVMLFQCPPSDALGLTTQSLLPLVEGIPVACHADPGDTLGVAKTIARKKVTILFARPALLQSLADDESVHPLMLDSLRLVVAGFEPLNEKMRIDFELKFGKKIYPGFGAPETAPFASVNIPDALNPGDWKVQQGSVTGSMGMPLPGSSFRIVDPASRETLPLGSEGLVLFSGDQLTPGYLGDEEATREAIIEIEGQRWFLCGFKGYLTEEGFLVVTAPG
jgi:acyl-[acyl-carrier-protein]-phospholipid O-acyltransferase/long-chain-fatty-acid--[acyl-carrier-protein] ligase